MQKSVAAGVLAQIAAQLERMEADEMNFEDSIDELDQHANSYVDGSSHEVWCACCMSNASQSLRTTLQRYRDVCALYEECIARLA